jgi:hypothetical protein
MGDVGESLKQQYPGAIPTKEDSARAMKIRAQLHQVASASPDTPDGQRAARMVQQIDSKFSQHWFHPATPDAESPGETFVRHFADSATFGGASKAGEALVRRKVEGYETPDRYGQSPASLSAESRDLGDTRNPGSALIGEVAGAAVPYGGPGLAFRGAGALAKGIRVGKEASTLAHVTAGAARGAATSAIASPVVAGARAAISGEDMTPRERIAQALEAMKAQATSPATYTVGAGLGALEGGSQAFRAGSSQTARDIRTVEDVAKGTATPLGPMGGYYESPILKGMHTDEDVGEVAHRAATSVQGKLNRQFKAAGDEYAAGTNEARDSGALARDIDPNPLLQQAYTMLKDHRLTTSTKAAIEREVVNPLLDIMTSPGGNGTMRLEDFNAFKGKLGDVAHVPVGGDSTFQNRAFGELADTARTMRHATALGDVDRAYAQRMDKLEGAHEAMGFRNKTHTDEGDPVAVRKMANFVARHGEDTKTAGMQNEDARRIESLFPGMVTQELSAPEMLRARQRMTPGLGGSGGLHERVGGFIHHNAEPLAVGAYQMGKRATGAMAPTDAAVTNLRNSMGLLFEAHDAENAKQAERADTLKGGSKGPVPEYIDRVEEGRAVLLDAEGNTRTVDASTLPRGATEGGWVQGGAIVPAPESKAGAIRKRLSADDKGGRLAL